MAPTGSPPATSRTRPMKLATPPMPVLPRVSSASSAPTSKSSRCTRITTSAPGDRREEGDLVARTDRVVPADILLVHGDAQDPRVLERLGESRPAAPEPIEQRRHGSDARRRLYPLLGLADPGAQPGKIEQLHDPQLRLRRPYFNPADGFAIRPPRSVHQLAEGQELDGIAGREAADAFADLDEAVGLDHRGENAGAVARKLLRPESVCGIADQARAHIL